MWAQWSALSANGQRRSCDLLVPGSARLKRVEPTSAQIKAMQTDRTVSPLSRSGTERRSDAFFGVCFGSFLDAPSFSYGHKS